MIIDISSFELSNLRSIKNSGNISIAPINILLGLNGTGKSSFMRFFQIIQQSYGINKKAPLLFYGKEVDFGSFKEARCKFSEEKFIGFGVTFYLNFLNNINSIGKTPIKINFLIGEHDENTYVKNVKIKLHGDIININLSPSLVENISINGVLFADVSEHLGIDKSSFFPFEKRMHHLSPSLMGKAEHFYRNIFSRLNPSLLVEWAQKELSSSAFQKTGLYTFLYREKHDVLFDLNYPDANFSAESIAEQLDKRTKVAKKLLQVLKDEKKLAVLKHLLIFTYLPALFSGLDQAMAELADSISYIGPIRATAQRYYRNQELDVSQIDSFGGNVPFFIDSMPKNDLDEFKSWVSRFFNFLPDKDKIVGHIALSIQEEGSKHPFNLADVGFGYSQILPILIQLWSLAYRPKFRRKTTLFFIEQPELHLHPALQSKLIEACIDAIKFANRKNVKIKIFIETHSDKIVTKVGKCIIDKKIRPLEANIYLFNKKLGICDISNSSFDQYGSLKNWPFGFFDGD